MKHKPKHLTNFLIGVVGALLYYLFQSDGAYGSWPRIAADIALVPVIASVLYLVKVRTLPNAIFTVVIYQTWNMFLSPYLWTEKIVAVHRVINEEHVPTMAFFSMLAVWSLYFGYYATINSKRKTRPFFPDRKFPNTLVGRYMIVAIVLGFTVGIVDFMMQSLGLKTSFLAMISQMLPTAVLCLFSIYIVRGGKNPFLIVLISIYVAYYFVYYVGGTLFIYSILLVMAPLAVYIVEKGKIPVAATVLITIALLPIYMSRHDYRSEGLYSSGAERMAIGMKILEEEYVHFSLEKNMERLKQRDDESNVDNRFEGVSYLATVVYCQEDLNYPYQYGQTFMWLPTMVVPHFLMPMRPGQNMGDDWAVYYQVKGADWKASINFPMLVEFYCNFGWLGMIILPFFQGWFIAFVCRKFNGGKGDLNLLFLLFVMPQLFVIEANITLAYGLIIQVMFVIWLFQKFGGKKQAAFSR